MSQVDAASTVEMARRLEVFQSVVKTITRTPRFEPRVPTTIVLFGERRAYESFAPKVSGGVFVRNQRANYALVDADRRVELDALPTLLHEYTHYIVHNNTEYTYPGWYHEGLAELMSGTDVTEDAVQVGLPTAWGRELGIDAIRQIPLRSLLREPPSPELRNVYYAKAWRLVHYLTYGRQLGFPDRSAQLARYLVLADQGIDPDEACVEAFGIGVDALEQELEAYIEAGRLPGLSLSRSSFPEPAEPRVRSLDGSEVALVLGDVALQRGDHRRAETLLRPLLASGPTAARAHFLLADALRFQRRSGEYEPLYARGFALAPDDALNRLDYAEFVWHRATQASGAERTALIGETRVHIERALELDPELPDAHAKLGRTYLAFVGENPAAAIPHLRRALELYGSDFETLGLLASAYTRSGRLDEAQRSLVEMRGYADGAPRRQRRIDELGAQLRRAREQVRQVQRVRALPHIGALAR